VRVPPRNGAPAHDVVPFEATTADGVRLVGHRSGTGPDALVFCHGFTGHHRKPRLVVVQEALAERFSVYAFDFRGHGGSDGRSAMGAIEHLDVDAVVRVARDDGARRVVTFGASMGGIAVVRHAALAGGVDAVVAVSTPARWGGHRSDAVRRAQWLTATRTGRATLRRVGVRVVPEWIRAEAPLDVVDRIAPIPLLLVHGRNDHFFDEEEAWALYRRAGTPKRLLLGSRFGHAEDGFTAAFGALVRDRAEAMLAGDATAEVPAVPAGGHPERRRTPAAVGR
jgi:pimeloyl-ACP methyl ester carboxylesterase